MDLMQYGVTSGDIEFLRRKELDGNLIIATSSNSATGDAASYVPATGKTFFLYAAKFTVGTFFAEGSNPVCELQNDGTNVETGVIVGNTDTAVGRSIANPTYNFIIKGDSLVGDGAKAYTIDIISNAASVTIYGTIIGWLEDT